MSDQPLRETVLGNSSKRFAYADPPYLGCCRLYDHFHGDRSTEDRGLFGYDGRCWDDPLTHQHLIDRLCSDFPDGWALSASSPSLRIILPMCPPDVRVASWCKTFGAFKKGVRPAYMWEPVIFRGGNNPPWVAHPPPPKDGKQTTPKDFYEHRNPDAVLSPITLEKGLTGAKPPAVCDWILDLLNVREGDRLDDLFPGTGVMSERFQLRTGASAEEWVA